MRINEAFSCLRSAILDWNGFLINNRFIKKQSEITWENHNAIDFSYPITASFVKELIENRQYSIQVQRDGSIFQIYYLYDRRGHKIQKASLSFFFLEPVLDKEWLVETGEYEYHLESEIGWFRFDYDCEPNNDKGVIHAKNHMHLSLFPDTRIMVDRIPNPKQFIEFAIATCYPDFYQETRLNEIGRYTDLNHICNINDPVIPNGDNDNLNEFVTHLRIPNRIAADNRIVRRNQRR